MTETLSFPNPSLKPGSLILITGANGFLGAWTVEYALRAGYRVRGSVRKLANLDHLLEGWKAIGEFEAIEVHEVNAVGAWNEAVKGVDGVIHIAGKPGGQWTDPDEVLAAVEDLLKTSEQAGVKRFVYTSSSFAAGFQTPGVQQLWDNTTYIEENQVKAIMAKGGTLADVGNYAGYKMRCEKAVLGRQSSTLSTSSVAFNNTFGPPLREGRSTAESPSLGLMLKAFTQEYDSFAFFPPQWYSDVRDVALVHLGSLLSTSSDIVNHRSWQVNAKYSVWSLIEHFRTLFPSHTWAEPSFPRQELTKTEIDSSTGHSVLAAFGRKPYTLAQTIEATVGREGAATYEFDEHGHVKLPANIEGSVPK